MEWVIGGTALVLIAFVWFGITRRQMRAWEERIKQKGELVQCWIAHADKTLYQVYDVAGYSIARVVFTTVPAPDPEQRLKEAAERLSKGKAVDTNVDADRVHQFANKLKEQQWMHPPFRLPKWFVGEGEVYTAIVQVYWRRLPEMHLTLPYLYCRVLLDQDGGIVMVDYSAEK